MPGQSAQSFLPCATPSAWFAAVLDNLPVLLIDHANCEKKAAATAMNLMYRHTTRPELLRKMSQLAREELLHFQQVVELMVERGVSYRRLSSSRYASGLGELVDQGATEALTDTLIMGAFIEARSCERFAGLVKTLESGAAAEPDVGESASLARLARYYRSLLRSEERHYQDYLALASDVYGGDLTPRLDRFAEREAELVSSPDTEFRFHSGPPA